MTDIVTVSTSQFVLVGGQADGILLSEGVQGPQGIQGIQGPAGMAAATVIASETLAAGDLVNLWDNASIFSARLASASAVGKEAHGFVSSAATAGQSILVKFAGTNALMTGLTPGVQFLSASTPGKTVAVAPTVAGQVIQRVGLAVAVTSLNFDPGYVVALS